MTDYLVPINRYHFAQFYRYGYTYIPKSILLTFDGNISENTIQDLAPHFSIISPFEYDEEYLILHLTKTVGSNTENLLFEIQDILAIYPLSKQAKHSIEEKIDQRIKLEQPIFESVLPIIVNSIQKKEIEKAIDALWQICEIEGDKNELLSFIGIENIFKGLSYRQKGVRASKIETGDYWSILIAYDRFDYFPNETIGFFYDAGQVFAYSKNMSTFEGSGLHSFLDDLSKNLKTPQIISAIESSAVTQSYRVQTTIEGLKKYVVAPLFLMLKDELRNADDLYSTKLLKYITELKRYDIQFKAAVVLLGAFFGYKKFYDLYYDKLNLRFYKSYNPKKEAIERENELPITKLTNIVKEESESQAEVSSIEILSSENQVEEIFHSQEVLKQIDAESPKVVEEQNIEIELKTNEVPPDNFNTIILDILKSKGEMTITNLGKELFKQTNNKMKNEAIETIIKDIPEIEKFKEKSAWKVRLLLIDLFNA
jgi:hypothetical protein